MNDELDAEERTRLLTETAWNVSICGETWTGMPLAGVFELARKIRGREPIVGTNGDGIRVAINPTDVLLTADWPGPQPSAEVQELLSEVLSNLLSGDLGADVEDDS